MKKVPKAFAELIDKEEQERSIETEKWKKISIEEKREEAIVFKAFNNAIKPYDGVTIGKFKLVVITDIKKQETQLYINNDLWMTFKLKRNVGSCAHEYSCDCPYKSWLTLRAIENSHINGYEQWFPCGITQFSDEKCFAVAMKEVIHNYKFKG
jgi:hypothetical protein